MPTNTWLLFLVHHCHYAQANSFRFIHVSVETLDRKRRERERENRIKLSTISILCQCFGWVPLNSICSRASMCLKRTFSNQATHQCCSFIIHTQKHTRVKILNEMKKKKIEYRFCENFYIDFVSFDKELFIWTNCEVFDLECVCLKNKIRTMKMITMQTQ